MMGIIHFFWIFFNDKHKSLVAVSSLGKRACFWWFFQGVIQWFNSIGRIADPPDFFWIGEKSYDPLSTGMPEHGDGRIVQIFQAYK